MGNTTRVVLHEEDSKCVYILFAQFVILIKLLS